MNLTIQLKNGLKKEWVVQKKAISYEMWHKCELLSQIWLAPCGKRSLAIYWLYNRNNQEQGEQAYGGTNKNFVM
jgi:hypothetical protein